jgi:hypothetical protein
MVVMQPWTMPKFSSITLTTGARQFVVQEAFVTKTVPLEILSSKAAQLCVSGRTGARCEKIVSFPQSLAIGTSSQG